MNTLHSLHARFLLIMPRIEAHARIYFRSVRCPGRKADLIADTIALAWKWFVRLDARGKDATQLASTLATLAARAVHCGRRVAGMERAKDAVNARTQKRRGFAVEKPPDFSTLSGTLLTDALADNTVTPPPDAAAFRVDFPRWMGSLPDRDRGLAESLMVGGRTRDAAQRFRVSEARVSGHARHHLCQHVPIARMHSFFGESLAWRQRFAACGGGIKTITRSFLEKRYRLKTMGWALSRDAIAEVRAKVVRLVRKQHS